MSTAHRDPLYMRNAKLIRQSTKARLNRGEYVPCIRCGGPIGSVFDVGHLVDASRGGSHDMDNLGPEHRYRTARCVGNRSAGGTLGAKRTNAKRKQRSTLPKPSTEGRLPW